MHHGGATCEVGAKPNAAGIGNAHARWHHVVGHARKLVDAVNNEVLALAQQVVANIVQGVQCNWADTRPSNVGEQTKCAVQVDGARQADAMRQQVQAQVHIGGACWRGISIDHECGRHDGNAAVRISRRLSFCWRVGGHFGTQAKMTEKGVERCAVCGNGCQANTPC